MHVKSESDSFAGTPVGTPETHSVHTDHKRRHYEIEEDESEENLADNRNSTVKFAVLEAEDIYLYKEHDSHCACGPARALHRAIEKKNQKSALFLSKFFENYSAEKIRAIVSIPCQSNEHIGLSALHLAFAIYNRADIVHKMIAVHVFLNVYTAQNAAEEIGKLNIAQFCCMRGDLPGFKLLEEKISVPLLQQMLNEKCSAGIYMGYTAFDILCLQANRYCEDLVVEEPTQMLFDKLVRYNACSSRIMLTAEHIDTLKSSGRDARLLIQYFCAILQNSVLLQDQDNNNKQYQSLAPIAHLTAPVDPENDRQRVAGSSTENELATKQELAAVLLGLGNPAHQMTPSNLCF